MNSAQHSRSRIVFDTDAINHLHDGKLSALLVPMLTKAGYQTLLSSINIAEIVATPNRTRRDSLLDFAGELRLQGDVRLLPHPIPGLVETELEAWLDGAEHVSYGVRGAFEGLQVILHEPKARTQNALAAVTRWKELEEHRFAETWAGFRQTWMPQLPPNDRPTTALEFMNKVLNDGPLLSTSFKALFHHYPQVAELSDAEITSFVAQSGPVRFFFEVQSAAIFHHLLSWKARSPHRKRDPMAMDTAQGIYLAVADTLVTDDSNLVLRLNEICEQAHPEKRILSSAAFLAEIGK